MPSSIRLGTSIVLRLALLVIGLATAACSDGPNTQYLPIGERCGSDDVCGTSPYACQTTGYPGGYCTKTCATDGDCVRDSVCALGHCRRKCTAPAECRSLEGYTCVSVGATSPYCDVSTP